MLAYILALVIGLGSIAFYMSAFFYPEVYRKGDFVWSGVGFFYALVLWFCAGQFGGAVLLGQAASVSLLGWLGWQTLKLRRLTTPEAERTPIFVIPGDRNASATAQMPWQAVTNLFGSKKKAAAPVPPPAAPVVPDTSVPEASVEETAVPPEPEAIAEPESPEIVPDAIAAPEVAPVEETPDVAIEPESEPVAEIESPSEVEKDAAIETEAELTPPTETTQSSEDWGDEAETEAVEPIQTAPEPAAVKAPAPPAAVPATPKSRTFGLLNSIVDRVKGLLGKGQSSAPSFPSMSTPTAPPPVAPFPTTFTADAELDEDWLEDVGVPVPEPSAPDLSKEVSDPEPPVAEAAAIEMPEETPAEVEIEVEAIDQEDEETEDLNPPAAAVVEPVTEEAIDAEIVESAADTSDAEPTIEIAIETPAETAIEPEVIESEIASETQTAETLEAIEVEAETPDTQPETDSEFLESESIESEAASADSDPSPTDSEPDETNKTDRKKNKGFGFSP